MTSDGRTYVHPRLGVATPPELQHVERRVSIKTPGATVTFDSGDGLPTFLKLLSARHFGSDDDLDGAYNPELTPDTVVFNVYGGDEHTYTVTIDPYDLG